MKKQQMLNRLFILVMITATLGGCKYQQLLKNGSPSEKLSAAKKYYNKEKYEKALPLFEELIGVFIGRNESQDIYFYYAYCHYGLGQYMLASYHFKRYVETYGANEHSEEASFMNAYCEYRRTLPNYLDQTQTKAAMERIQIFVNQYPESKYIEQCNEAMDELRAKILEKAYRTARLYYDMEDYRAAITSFENVLNEYPDLEERELIKYLHLKSAYLYAKNSVVKSQVERFSHVEVLFKRYQNEFLEADKKEAERIYRSAMALKAEAEKEIEKENKGKEDTIN